MADFINYNDSTPAAPGGYVNVKWQKDTAANISAYVPVASSGQTPWTQDIDGAGYSLSNVGQISVTGAGTGISVTNWGILALGGNGAFVGYNLDSHPGDGYYYRENGYAHQVYGTTSGLFRVRMAASGAAGTKATAWSDLVLIDPVSVVVNTNQLTVSARDSGANSWVMFTPQGSTSARIGVGILADASQFFIARYDTGGIWLGNPLVIDRATGNVTLANLLILSGLPTSASGLASGSLWRDAAAGNVVKIVP